MPTPMREPTFWILTAAGAAALDAETARPRSNVRTAAGQPATRQPRLGPA